MNLLSLSHAVLIALFKTNIVTSQNCGTIEHSVEAHHLSDGHNFKIVGGTNSRYGMNPWIINILKIDESNIDYLDLIDFPDLEIPILHHCGGSLISDKFVLSAAHCFENEYELYLYEQFLNGDSYEDDSTYFSVKNFTLVAGDYHTGVMDIYEQMRKIKRIIIHSKFSGLERFSDNDTIQPSPYVIPTIMTNDIALIEVSEPFIFSPFVRPICLPSSNKPESYPISSGQYKKCSISGWGSNLVGPIQGLTVNLKSAFVNIIDKHTCEFNYIKSYSDISMVEQKVFYPQKIFK